MSDNSNRQTKGDFVLTHSQVLEGVRLCHEKVRGIPNAVSVLMDRQDTLVLALGLYTLAIEEYGKALLLYDCLSGQKLANGYKVSTGIFGGRGAHAKKFSRAIARPRGLPRVCVEMLKGVRVPSNSRMQSATIQYGPSGEASVSIGAGLTGLFEDVTNIGAVSEVDLSERSLSFYIDWDDKAKQWSGDRLFHQDLQYQVVPDPDAFRQALEQFNDHLAANRV